MCRIESNWREEFDDPSGKYITAIRRMYTYNIAVFSNKYYTSWMLETNGVEWSNPPSISDPLLIFVNIYFSREKVYKIVRRGFFKTISDRLQQLLLR